MAVPATRQLLGDGNLTKTAPAHVIKVSTGTPDNVRGVKNRAITAGGTFTQALDADEIVELLLSCLQGGVTPTSSGGLAAPAAPVPTTATSGGTIAAGTYPVAVTYTGGGGETLASANGSVTTTGSTSTITVPSPSALAGATGWYAYVGQAGGAAGSGTRQQTAGSPTAIGTNLTLTAPPTNTGAAVPAANTTGAQLWTFKPSTTLDSQTWQWRDGYNDWQEAGVYVDTLKLAWSAKSNGDAMVTATLFGKDRVVSALTGALATRSPVWIEGWETALYIDALGGTPGTTSVGMGISGDLTISRHLGRKYFATNSQATAAVPLGEYDVTGTVVYEANAAGLAEYNNWVTTPANRLLRWQFGGNGAALGVSTLKRSITFDIPCSYTAADLTGDEDGTKVIKMSFQYQYDATNAFSSQIIATNSRAAAYA